MDGGRDSVDGGRECGLQDTRWIVEDNVDGGRDSVNGSRDSVDGSRQGGLEDTVDCRRQRGL